MQWNLVLLLLNLLHHRVLRIGWGKIGGTRHYNRSTRYVGKPNMLGLPACRHQRCCFGTDTFKFPAPTYTPSSSSSHIRILLSNCTFDTIVVLVEMLIIKTALNIPEPNWCYWHHISLLYSVVGFLCTDRLV